MWAEYKLHRVVVSILIGLLIVFLFLSSYLRPILEDERLGVAASLLIVIAAAAAFVTAGAAEEVIALQFGTRHMRELLSYALLGLLSLSSGIYLALSKTASLQTVAIVAAPHAFLFGAAELRMAKSLSRHPGYKRTLVFEGVVELVFGCTMLFAWKLSNEQTASLLSYVAVLSALELLPLLFCARPNPAGRHG